MSKLDLTSQELFKDLPAEVISALADVAERRTVRGGETLVTQGEKAIALYYVQSGRFRVVINKSKTVANVDAGEVIGELAFFAGGVRSADVVATRDSAVLRVSREDYDSISVRYPKLNQNLLRLISSRLVASTARSTSIEERPPRVIAFLSAGQTSIPANFISRLAAAMQATLGDDEVVQTMSMAESNTDSGSEYEAWLSTQEAQGGYILIDANGSTIWSERVCRNADGLVMVGDLAVEEHQANQQELAAMQWVDSRQRSLVLFRDCFDDEITGSKKWITPRLPRLHHHLALDTEADFQKLTRFLTGKAVGLVLAGGGALGCAHLGVMQALQEAKIPIDFIGGASAGAAMGCAVASGQSITSTLTQMEEMFVEAKAMARITVPIHSLLDPTVFDQQLKLRYGQECIADQAINFFAASTNLSNNTLHIHRDGPMWEAVRSSGSLPTVLPPFIDSAGNILVDGGVLDNSPVGVMHDLKSGPNIVVALADTTEDWRLGVDYDQVRGRWALMRDIVLRRKRQQEFPSIVEVMSRSMVISSRIASKETLSEQDQILAPPILPGMQLFDWAKGRELAESARHYTLQEIESGNLVV